MYRAVIHQYDFQYKYKTIGNKKIYAEGNEILRPLKNKKVQSFIKNALTVLQKFTDKSPI